MAARASRAAAVRKVISSTGRPPFTSARASGTASAVRSMVSTGMTGARAAMAENIHRQTLQPPSITFTVPVVKAASSLAR